MVGYVFHRRLPVTVIIKEKNNHNDGRYIWQCDTECGTRWQSELPQSMFPFSKNDRKMDKFIHVPEMCESVVTQNAIYSIPC